LSITCDLEFGNQNLALRLPKNSDLLALPGDQALSKPAEAVRESLANPIASPALAELIQEKTRQTPTVTAAIVVSDNTRPVPYRGPSGILGPVLELLRSSGIQKIKILIANGTHRDMTEQELRAMLPPEAFAPGIEIINHRCDDPDALRPLGKTRRGTEVFINRHYLDADLKILTGFVEPHFMAGVSGGGKSICPGLVGEATMSVFHGAQMMDHEKGASLVIEGNPVQAEVREVADMAGADFIVNVTLDRDKRLTAVFSGDLRAAHDAAITKVLESSRIQIIAKYDLVVTHAGFVGVNHYQSAKAAVEASKALKSGGSIIMAANNIDPDPVGSQAYRSTLALLCQLGPKEFRKRLLSPQWEFTFEQWQPQAWARVLQKLLPAGKLVYCSPQLARTDFAETGIPAINGCAGIAETIPGKASLPAIAQASMQQAIDELATERKNLTLAVLVDGPFAVPYFSG
jgi:lactate racemase